MLEPARALREAANRRGDRLEISLAQLAQELARGFAGEQRRALKRYAQLVEALLEIDEARVRAAQDRDLLVRRAAGVQLIDPLDEEVAFRVVRREGAHDRRRTVGARGAQGFLGSSETWNDPVRKLENLRRRAIIRLQPDHVRVRKASRQGEEVLRRRAGERVDRLVVVADRAELVAAAEPAVEQRLLEEIDVLVLVDGEGAEAFAYRRERMWIVLEQPDRELDQILEIGVAALRLATLVLAKHACHQVGRNRRRVLAELALIRTRRQAAVLGPLHLRGEIGRGTEPVRLRQRVADMPKRERFRGDDLARRLAEPVQLSERGRVERAGRHAFRAERLEPRAHSGGGLVSERHGEDLACVESTACDLLRDPPRDRRRLAGTRAGEDADRSAHRLDRAALVGIQPVENMRGVHASTLERGCDNAVTASCEKPKGVRPWGSDLVDLSGGRGGRYQLLGRASGLPVARSICAKRSGLTCRQIQTWPSACRKRDELVALPSSHATHSSAS